MKMQIKSLIVVAAVSGVVAAGCSGSKEKAAVASDSIAQETVTDADIRGQWYIENIVFNDSDYVRPEEAVPGVRQYINFEDSTYSIMTNCNTISGPYTIKGDSITLGAGLMTEMACDNRGRLAPHSSRHSDCRRRERHDSEAERHETG